MAHEQAPKEKIKKRLSIVQTFVSVCIKMVFYVFAVAMGSVVVELVGVVTGLWGSWFNEPGSLHSENMLRYELKNIESLVQYFDFLVSSMGLYDQRYLGLIDSMVVSTDNYFPHLTEYAFIVRNVVLTVWAKVIVLVLMLPTYFVFGMVGFTRGLVARDLRKWESGRELGSRYHTWLRLLPDLSFWLWATYLAFPITVNPFLVIGPVVILFGVTVFQLAYWTKNMRNQKNRYMAALLICLAAVFCSSVQSAGNQDAGIKNMSSLIRELEVVRAVAMKLKDETVISNDSFPFNYRLFIGDVESMIKNLEKHASHLENTPRFSRINEASAGE